VNRESVLLLGGPRALLLQLAHPLIAQGVGDHSRFLEDPLGRLRATLDAMLGIAFGDLQTARRIGGRIRAAHERVRGVLRDGTRRFPSGTPYDARDPDLLLWVHATLVDSALEVYGRVVAPLEEAERAEYYEESKRVARLCGVPKRTLPESLAQFDAYFRDTVQGELLEVTPLARELAEAVLYPSLPWIPRRAGELAALLTAGLLPAAVRERYGLRWTPARERAFLGILRLLRLSLPLLPRALRDMPQARRAMRSERRGEGTPGLVA
jgi:uncharacterized protein (DUF2236 family)